MPEQTNKEKLLERVRFTFGVPYPPTTGRSYVVGQRYWHTVIESEDHGGAGAATRACPLGAGLCPPMSPTPAEDCLLY